MQPWHFGVHCRDCDGDQQSQPYGGYTETLITGMQRVFREE